MIFCCMVFGEVDRMIAGTLFPVHMEIILSFLLSYLVMSLVPRFGVFLVDTVAQKSGTG